jgi:hypothetical protein
MLCETVPKNQYTAACSVPNGEIGMVEKKTRRTATEIVRESIRWMATKAKRKERGNFHLNGLLNLLRLKDREKNRISFTIWRSRFLLFTGIRTEAA